MANRNRRKVYEEAEGGGSGPVCRDCGCRHFNVVRKERIGAEVSTLRLYHTSRREIYTAGTA